MLSGADTGAGRAHLGSSGGDFGARGSAGAARSSTPALRNIAARRASIPNSSRAWRSSSASTSRRYERFFLMLWNYIALRFRQELFPRRQRAPTDQGEAAGLDLARHLADAAHLPDLDPARHPQGGQGRLALRRLDVGRHHHRLCDPGIPVRDPAHHPVRRRLVLRLVPAARADLRELGATAVVAEDPRLFLAPDAADHLHGARRPSPP